MGRGSDLCPYGLPSSRWYKSPWGLPQGKETRVKRQACLPPSFSSNTSAPNCLRLALGMHTPIPSNTQPLPPFNKNGGKEVSI